MTRDTKRILGIQEINVPRNLKNENRKLGRKMAKKKTAKKAGRFAKKPTVAERKDRKPGGFQASGAIQKPPGELGTDGQWLWDSLTSVLPDGLIQSSDSAALFGLCKWWDIFKYWEMECTSADQSTAYKATCMAGSAWKHVQNGLAKFGLTPNDRMKIKIPDGEGEDGFSKFLEQFGVNN